MMLQTKYQGSRPRVVRQGDFIMPSLYTRVIFYVRRIGLYLYKYKIYGTISIYFLKGLASIYQLILILHHKRLHVVRSRYIALKKPSKRHWSKSMSF